MYTHVWDDGTPLEKTLETLGWLVQQGKVCLDNFNMKHCFNLNYLPGSLHWMQQYDWVAATVGSNHGEAAKSWPICRLTTAV